MAKQILTVGISQIILLFPGNLHFILHFLFKILTMVKLFIPSINKHTVSSCFLNLILICRTNPSITGNLTWSRMTLFTRSILHVIINCFLMIFLHAVQIRITIFARFVLSNRHNVVVWKLMNSYAITILKYKALIRKAVIKDFVKKLESYCRYALHVAVLYFVFPYRKSDLRE